MSLLLTRSTPLLLRRVAPAIGSSCSTRLFSSVQNLDDATAVADFRELNHKSVLYFTASWCGPCKQIKPIYQKLAESTEGVAFGLVDVDVNSDAAVDFEIAAVPTFVLFRGDQPVHRFSGADPTQLQQKVKDLAGTE